MNLFFSLWKQVKDCNLDIGEINKNNSTTWFTYPIPLPLTPVDMLKVNSLSDDPRSGENYEWDPKNVAFFCLYAKVTKENLFFQEI